MQGERSEAAAPEHLAAGARIHILVKSVGGFGGHRFHLADLEAHADDGAADVFLAVVRIRSGDDGAVGQQVKAGVKAVFEGLEQTNSVLAGHALLDVVVGADPGDEAGFVLRLRRGVAEDDYETAIGQTNAVMAIAGETPRRVHGLTPCLTLVAAEHDETRAAAAIFAHEAAEFVAIR